MRTVGDELDLVQSHLHDDGELWPRAELLRWYNDGYVRMLADSQAVRRIFITDVPGRLAWSFAYEWESSLCPGLHQRFSRPGATHHSTFTWEQEQLSGLSTVNASGDTSTQPWERAYSGAQDAHFRFALSRQHDRIVRAQWSEKALHGANTRELDQQQQQWWRESGQPLYWFSGLGRDQSVELFAIDTDYTQEYELQATHGTPRVFSGSRTYGATGSYGIPRRITSSDRQYAPQAYADGSLQFLGTPREYQSTVNSLAVVQVIVPTRSLGEKEAATLVPVGLRKYLRFFVLAMALGRKGEGQQNTIAGHYHKRFARGVEFFRKLSNLVFADRVYARQEYDGTATRKLPRVRLPSTFERVW